MFALKILATVISQPLSEICSNCIKEQNFPSGFKIARIKPLPKNCLSDEPSDFRPISLLPALSKLLEKLLQLRMTIFIEQNNLLNSKQFGVRRNRSCVHILTVFTEFERETIDNSKHGAACLLGLKKRLIPLIMQFL